MTTSLRANLETLASSFASAVVGIVRSAPLEELLLQTSQSRPGRAPRTPTRAPVRPAARASSSGRLKRRSAEDVAKVLDKVVGLVKRHKAGLRAEQIRQQLKMRPNEMPRVLGEGLAKKMIKKKGQKRATTYFAR